MRSTEQLWEIELQPLPGHPDRLAENVLQSLTDLGFSSSGRARAAKSYLVAGSMEKKDAERIARELLCDQVVQQFAVDKVSSESVLQSTAVEEAFYQVLYKPGVMDPESQSVLGAIQSLGLAATDCRTVRKYWLSEFPPDQLQWLATKILSNDSIEQLVIGPLPFQKLSLGQTYTFGLSHVELLSALDEKLLQISRDWQLSLTLVEMQTIQTHYRELNREPTDIELETIAQTWSEHCSHKTLAGRVHYQDENGELKFNNLLKETIFAATQTIRADLGDRDWCVSVFKDNAGVVRFDENWNVTFKVETHNRPSALEPYGGANTGLGGVIRDTLGTGLGAKPICNTDVFCFADPNTATESLPPGVLHPRRIMKGVVNGVRDYGNRMGIPTVNGAVIFDQRYLGNPMVFCGSVGLIPNGKTNKQPQAGDWIVTIGGRTGRDGIHGATFSSVELTDQSEKLSGGAVQIGNAITEKMLADVMLQARDLGLYNAVTDCGAGGFSSAVGEMGEGIGAEVWLERVPLKYAGLSYTEIWISEAQERMVLAVPPHHWDAFEKLCSSESVEATIIGVFAPTGELTLKYQDHVTGRLSMEFLHGGRPPVVRNAKFTPRSTDPQTARETLAQQNPEQTLKKILGSLNVASKHWIIRQYDHEVQANSVVKPLVGVANDGPSDAAVVRPRLESDRAIAVACGMNPWYGDIDPYHMAAASIDEAIRNCVAVGADPDQIGILDNFCWGYTDRPETLGTLVRAALACRDVSIAFGTPFISGKDSLNNEFSYIDREGSRQTISIPSTLLISALGMVPQAEQCVTMDLKQAGNQIVIVGLTGEHLGGSHALLETAAARLGKPPAVNVPRARQLYRQLHQAIRRGWVRSAHDLSEGGLAVAAAEMSFAGGLGVEIDVAQLPWEDVLPATNVARLFSESSSRILCEIEPQNLAQFIDLFRSGTTAVCGQVTAGPDVIIRDSENILVQCSWQSLKHAWQSPLDWK